MNQTKREMAKMSSLFSQMIKQETWTQSLLVPLLLLFPIVFTFLTKFRKGRRANLPPSPPKLPIIGNLHQLMGRLPHLSFHALSQKYGPLLLVHLGSSKALVVSSAAVAEEMIKKHDQAFANRHAITALIPFGELGRDVVFHPYGDYLRQAKKICTLHLLSQNMVREFKVLRDEEISNMLEKFRLSSLSRSDIDLRDAFFTVAGNVVYRSFTGRRSEEKIAGMTYKEWNIKLKRLMGAFCFEDLFPSLAWMDRLTGFTADLRRTFKELDGFIDQIISIYEGKSEIDLQSSSQKNFVGILLQLQKEGKLDFDLTREDIKAIIQSLVVAATDNVVALMEWMMTELIKHPTAMNKVQEEVRSIVGNKRKIDSTDIDQMQYLKCVIKETMRLHPFGIFPRETIEPVKMCGYEIPPRTKVMVNLWSIQRDPKVWENPDKFIPERFADGQIDFRGQHQGFIPFGFGRRFCPGVSYALAVVENTIANVLYWYDWELPRGVTPENLDMSEKFALAVLKKQPLRLVPVP